MKFLMAAFVATTTFAAPHGYQPDRARVVRAVTKGMLCKQQPSSRQMDCEYRVGRGLYFAIVGIGDDDTGITFYKVDWDDDYYATIGVMHGCIIVKEGKRLVDAFPEDGKVRPEFAFVSPKNGKVYSTWQQCQAGARR